MLHPDEPIKKWVDSVIRKSQKLVDRLEFTGGAASLVLLGAFIAIDRFCERKSKLKSHASMEKRLQDSAVASTAAPPGR